MIRSLRLRGFRRYTDEKLAFDSGTCFIEGENNAGKTTLFLAIEYALFGTAGGIRSPMALLQPGALGVGVELVFDGKDGKRYRLQRVHAKPPKARTKLIGHFTLKEIAGDDDERYLLSSDFQDHEDALALKLQEITGISRRIFDLAVHVRQGQVAAILDGDAGLDIALGITAAVSANEELRALALEDEQSAASLPALEASLAHVERERALLATDDAKAKKSIAALEEKIAAAEQVLADLGEAEPYEADEEDLDEADDDEELPTTSVVDREHADLTARIARRDKLLKAKGAAAGAVCEHCGSVIDAKKAKAELAQWKKDLIDVEAKLEEEHEQRQAEKEKREAAARKREEARMKAAAAKMKERAEREKKRARAEADLESAQAALDEQREALESKVERCAEAEREHARLGVEVAALRKRTGRAAKLRTLAAAFKTLQEELRARAAEQLATSTLRIHKQLADVAGAPEEIAALTIDPVRYQVVVTPHDAGTAMPASLAQGGGHKLLLGLAFRLALVERLGPFPFLLLDEPTYGLDSKRRGALLEKIAKLELAPQILLITHQNMGDVAGQRVLIERKELVSTSSAQSREKRAS